MRNIAFTAKGWTDLIEWSKTDRKVFNKISRLIEETARNPFKGTGKPELLKHKLKGHWSRQLMSIGLFIQLATKKLKLFPACTIINKNKKNN